MPRATQYTDNFNRSDRSLDTDVGGTPATEWDGAYTGRDGHQIVTNVVKASGDVGVQVLTISRAVLANDQYAKGKIDTFSASGDWCGVVVRCANEPTVNHYMVLARSGAGLTQLYRVDGGTLVSLGSVANPGWVVGDTVELEAIGTAITALRNGVTIGLSATDAIYASGRAGMTTATSTGQNNNMKMDDFEAGNITAGSGGSRRRRQGTSAAMRQLLKTDVWEAWPT